MNSFFYLAITIIIEFIVYAIAIRKNKLALFWYCVLINLFTWPLANIFYSAFGMFWFIEAGVFVAESVLIKYLLDITWKKAIIISLIANITTAIVGLII